MLSEVKLKEKLLKHTPAKTSIFLWGSRVYGTHNENSDFDLHVVIAEDQYLDFNLDLFADVDLHLHTYSDFQDALTVSGINAVECYFLPSEHKWKTGLYFEYQHNPKQIYKTFSAKAKHSWDKARLKLQEDEEGIALKSLFHAFRLADFGKQLLQTGKILNYGSRNTILNRVCALPYDWEIWESRFKQQFDKELETLHNCYTNTCQPALKDK